MTDCFEKLIALSEKNQVSIVWTLGHNGITQNETAVGLARRRARTKLTGPESCLSVSLTRYRSKKKIELKVASKWNGKSVKNIRPGKYVWKDLPIDMSNTYKQTGEETLQVAGGALYGARQREIFCTRWGE